MNLSQPSAVAFAVSDGVPSDAREWITLDLAGHPTPHRRGFIVATEPLEQTWRGHELAAYAREILVYELRRQSREAPEIALGRAFAAANGVLYEEWHTGPHAGYEHRNPIGATVVLLDDTTATIGYVPPGQLVFIQDGLVYAIPDLDSWTSSYAQEDDHPGAEPLGFATWTAPTIVQTELAPGDTLLLASTNIGEAFSSEIRDAGLQPQDMSYLFGRDPDAILDLFRGMVLDQEIVFAGVAVLGYPPKPSQTPIETLGDVTERARDRFRSLRGVVSALFASQERAERERQQARQQRWRRKPAPQPTPATVEGVAEESSATRHARGWGRGRWAGTWARPSQVRQFGLPRAHGVEVHRAAHAGSGDPSWRSILPRTPRLSTAVVGLLVLLLVGVIAVGGVLLQERLAPTIEDYETNLASVDQRLLAAQDLGNSEDVDNELLRAQESLDAARDNGAPADALQPRQQAITVGRDEANNVVRMSDLERIGTLPGDLQDGDAQAVFTDSGIFIASGDLYQVLPEDRSVQLLLEAGEEVDGEPVGELFGVAFDVYGLYATDGSTVFVVDDEAAWRAVTLEEINEQPWPAAPVAAFDSNFYLLESEYRQIYRFTMDAERAATPEPVSANDWVLPGLRQELLTAESFAIDGNIYVVLGDGRLLTFNQGDLVSDITLPYFDDADPVALLSGVATGYLYVVVLDDEGGRIIATDQSGETAYQLQLPIGFDSDDAEVTAPFTGLQDVAIDEDTGTVYFINADAVWTSQFTLPEIPGQEPATPEDEPDVVASPEPQGEPEDLGD